MTITELKTLAAAARPTSDDDWGSERQIDAENTFMDAVMERLGDGKRWEYLEMWSLKATTDEMIDEAMSVVRGTSDGCKRWTA